MSKEKPFRLETKALAERIYVDLMGRNVVLAEGGVKVTVSAENVAKLAFMLAESFLRVQDDLNAENLPKDPTFKLGVEDIASWTKGS
ncbi:MAG TPA: hypothetical protein VKR38_10715 [Usitatibacter sp.]|nr:hypothetical protein [Usitatibacter sp.]